MSLQGCGRPLFLRWARPEFQSLIAKGGALGLETRRRGQLRWVAATLAGILGGILLSLIAKKIPGLESWWKEHSESGQMSSAPQIHPKPTPVSTSPSTGHRSRHSSPQTPAAKLASKPEPKDRSPILIVVGPDARLIVKSFPQDLRFDQELLQSLVMDDLRGRLKLVLFIRSNSSYGYNQIWQLPVNSSDDKVKPMEIFDFLPKAKWKRTDGGNFVRKVDFIVDFAPIHR
jgi:hypothetical protein